VAADSAVLYVSARESATQRAVILKVGVGSGQVLATGDVLGTPNVMTDPVALALSADRTTVYVADISSVFSDSVGGVLAVKNGQISVLSTGSIDGPSGIAIARDGSLVVCGSDPASGDGAVFSVAADTGTTTLIAEGGALTEPTGLGIAPNGTIFVTDAGLRLASAQLVSVGSGTAAVVAPIQDTCGTESGVAWRSDTFYFAARHAGAGKLSSIASGSSTELPVIEGAGLVSPQGVTADADSVFVADQDAGGTGEIFVLR
jgi:DNA-binding beta-propeller fold protein YncE